MSSSDQSMVSSLLAPKLPRTICVGCEAHSTRLHPGELCTVCEGARVEPLEPSRGLQDQAGG